MTKRPLVAKISQGTLSQTICFWLKLKNTTRNKLSQNYPTGFYIVTFRTALSLSIKSTQNAQILLLFYKWEYSGGSTREAAYSLCSKGLQSLKVSNIWALPMMALPCNGYKLNLLTSASMCHMALCYLCWKLHSNFSFYWKNELKQAFSTCCLVQHNKPLF